MSLPAITFVVALTLSFAILIGFTGSAPSSKTVRRRLVMIQDSLRAQAVGAFGAELRERERTDHSSRLSAFLERFRFAKWLKLLLLHADSGMGVGGTVLASAGAAVASGAVSFYFFHVFLLSGALGIAAAAVPCVLLRFKRDRRTKAFNTALPDAIDLMTRSLRAGHAIGSSIEMVAEQLPQPLAFEFFQVFQQQRLGLQFRDALLQMGTRVPSRDLQFLITAILVQKETGGDLTEILDRASHVIRERVRIQGEVRTRTAQGRLTGWILGLHPITMLALVNLISPGYSSILFHDPIGQDLLFAGALLIVLGGIIIAKIVDIKV